MSAEMPQASRRPLAPLPRHVHMRRQVLGTSDPELNALPLSDGWLTPSDLLCVIGMPPPVEPTMYAHTRL